MARYDHGGWQRTGARPRGAKASTAGCSLTGPVMDTHEGRQIMEANATGSGLTNMWIKTKMDET